MALFAFPYLSWDDLELSALEMVWLLAGVAWDKITIALADEAVVGILQ